MQRFLLAMALFFLLIPWAVIATAWGETCYIWVNQEGVSCYSNVSPPGKGTAFDVAFTTIDRPSIGPDAAEPLGGETPQVRLLKVPPSHQPQDALFQEVLRRRIRRHQAAIAHITTCLRSHPHDRRLRTSLTIKKRYLAKDLLQARPAIGNETPETPSQGRP